MAHSEHAVTHTQANGAGSGAGVRRQSVRVTKKGRFRIFQVEENCTDDSKTATTSHSNPPNHGRRLPAAAPEESYAGGGVESRGNGNGSGSAAQVDDKVAEQSSQDLSNKAIGEFREVFRLFDKDNDGWITARDLRVVFRSYGKSPTESELKDIIHDVDADGDGRIDFDEFLSMMNSAGSDDIKEAFCLLDEDNDGYIQAPDIRQMSSMLDEEPLTERQITTVMSNLDLDGDGQLNFTDFAKALRH